MAARQEAARRKKVMQARIGAGVAAAVVLGAVIWIIVAATGGNPTPNTAATNGPTECTWNLIPEATGSPSPSPSLPPGIKDVGLPPTNPPHTGYQVLTFTTNLGVIKVEMDYSKTPCTAASMAHLASKKFFDNSSCHRLVAGIFALQCGDPSGSGSGGATYKFADENLPKDKLPAYHEGDVAMANTGEPGTNGSQFFFLWSNSTLQGDYSLWGHVIEGLNIVKQVAAGGDDGAFEPQPGGGHPKAKFVFKSVTAGPITETPAPRPSTSASASASASPSASASAT